MTSNRAKNYCSVFGCLNNDSSNPDLSFFTIPTEQNRYKNFKYAKAIHPFRNTVIPVIFDKSVDMKFGTGALNICPAHDLDDFAIAKSHNLPLLQVIGENGLIQNCESFNNNKRYKCRELLLEKLNNLGLLKGVSAHAMVVPICSHSYNSIDVLPKEQWFVSSREMNKIAKNLVKTGSLKIVPEECVNNWLDLTEDNRDWCISRQFKWGHQIPAYKCSFDNDVAWIAATDKKTARKQAAVFLNSPPDSIRVEKDTDVLDTWFSTSIYPLAILGWPKRYQCKDFRQFYPLNLLAARHDVLQPWVYKMVVLGLVLTNNLPFNEILLHGTICDGNGDKMCEFNGNVIEPMDVIKGISLEDLRARSEKMEEIGLLSKDELEKAIEYQWKHLTYYYGIPECGVDALRFTLLSQDFKSKLIPFDLAQCNANKMFCSKIWESVHYTHAFCDKLRELDKDITEKDLTSFDKWILSKLADMVGQVNKSMNNYDYHIAAKSIKTLLLNEFCEVYLEAIKPGCERANSRIIYAHAHTMSAVLNTALRCLVPFMVYLTDELISKIPTFENNFIYNFNDSNKIYLDFPKAVDFRRWKNDVAEQRVGAILDAVKIVIDLKKRLNLNNTEPCMYVDSIDKVLLADIEDNKAFILSYTRCSDVKFDKAPGPLTKSKFGEKTEVIIGLN